MDNPLKHYWDLRLDKVKNTLLKNNFEVFTAATCRDAGRIVLEKIIPATQAQSISWGGSMTFLATGIHPILTQSDNFRIIDTFEKNIPAEESLERRRQALLVDLFITGTNAVTEAGQLVNLDMYGNRVAALTFGPKNVIILVGRNKITANFESAFERIKTYSAPANTIRLNKSTPCSKSASCHNCSSPDRICNTWTITEKSFPKGRIKVVLIKEDLGL